MVVPARRAPAGAGGDLDQIAFGDEELWRHRCSHRRRHGRPSVAEPGRPRRRVRPRPRRLGRRPGPGGRRHPPQPAPRPYRPPPRSPATCCRLTPASRPLIAPTPCQRRGSSGVNANNPDGQSAASGGGHNLRQLVAGNVGAGQHDDAATFLAQLTRMPLGWEDRDDRLAGAIAEREQRCARRTGRPASTVRGCHGSPRMSSTCRADLDGVIAGSPRSRPTLAGREPQASR